MKLIGIVCTKRYEIYLTGLCRPWVEKGIKGVMAGDAMFWPHELGGEFSYVHGLRLPEGHWNEIPLSEGMKALGDEALMNLKDHLNGIDDWQADKRTKGIHLDKSFHSKGLEFYLDMDGVLVNLEKGVVELLKLDYEHFKRARRPEVWEMAEDLGIEEKELWDHKTGIVAKQPASFYANLEKYSWSQELYDRCKKMGEVNFLTAPLQSAACHAGKWDWIYNFAGEEGAKKLIFAKEKFKLAAPHRILIDDKPKNIDAFNEKGGFGILFPSRGNKLHAYEENPLDYVFSEVKRRAS